MTDSDVLAFFALAQSPSSPTAALEAALSAGAGVRDLLLRGLVADALAPLSTLEFLKALLMACTAIDSAATHGDGTGPVVEEARVVAATRVFELLGSKQLTSRRAHFRCARAVSRALEGVARARGRGTSCPGAAGGAAPCGGALRGRG